MSQTPVVPLRRSTPEEQGVHSEAILDFIHALEAQKFAMHSLMLLRHGRVIAEGWWAPFEPASKRYIYSCTKSFTSTAVGFAVTEGLLKVKDKVVSFFPGDLPEVISDNLAAMRVQDLLTMTSGHAVDSTLALIPPGVDNWAQALLDFSVDYKPGTHFLYDTGASYLLSAILQKVTGQTTRDYLMPRLFEPLGIYNVSWDVCPRGISTGGWGLSLTTEELARFGLFYAQKGTWNGTRLLPEEWIEEATAFHVPNGLEDRVDEPTDWRQGYGYQFWRCQHKAYRADGAAGQFCVVMPDQDAVLVMTSETSNMQGILDLAWQHLLPVMEESPLHNNPMTQDLLRQKLSALKITLAAAQPYPETAALVSGTIFTFSNNETGVRKASLTFEPGSCRFRLWDDLGEHQMVCGNGNWIKNETQMPFMIPTLMSLILNKKVVAPVKVAASGEWKDSQTYVMSWQYLETPHTETVSCQFAGDELVLEVASSIDDPHNLFMAGKEKHFRGKGIDVTQQLR